MASTPNSKSCIYVGHNYVGSVSYSFIVHICTYILTTSTVHAPKHGLLASLIADLEMKKITIGVSLLYNITLHNYITLTLFLTERTPQQNSPQKYGYKLYYGADNLL